MTRFETQCARGSRSSIDLCINAV